MSETNDKVKLFTKLSHDLRNPLGVVLAYSQLLERALSQAEGTDPRLLRQLQGIARSAHRMEELIETYTISVKQVIAEEQGAALGTDPVAAKSAANNVSRTASSA